MAQPRCPFCNLYGLDGLQVENKTTFLVIYCGGCGAIHGVLPVDKPSSQIETIPPAEPVQEPEIKIEPPATIQPSTLPPKTIHPKDITKEKIGAMVARGGYMALAYLPPLCPKCNIEMEKFTVPEGHTEAGQEFWRCPNFQTCRQWQREG